MTIRPARADDVDEIVQTYEWLFAPPGSPPPDWQPARAAERLHAAVGSTRALVLIATTGDAGIAGVCTTYLDLVSVRFGRRAWIEDLVVTPQARGHGVGSALLHWTLAWAQDQGVDYVALESATARTDAHRFYLREGATQLAATFRWTFAAPA